MLKRVVVTGASGLLGSAVAARLACVTDVLALGHRTEVAGTRAIDLSVGSGVRALADEDWDGLVHCAAFRNPDFCEVHRAEAWRLNAEVPGELAELAARRGARMVHISTDYVFPGTNPPYAEDAPVAPLNYYGETKAAAERLVRSACQAAVVLRVPALYGSPPPPLSSNFVEDAIRVAREGERAGAQDDVIVRYPTHTRDVAAVIAFLLDVDCRGIVHAGAEEATTRYRWACMVAEALGLPTDGIRRMTVDPNRVAPRPVDSHLSCRVLSALGGPMPRGVSYWLPHILEARPARPDVPPEK